MQYNSRQAWYWDRELGQAGWGIGSIEWLRGIAAGEVRTSLLALSRQSVTFPSFSVQSVSCYLIMVCVSWLVIDTPLQTAPSPYHRTALLATEIRLYEPQYIYRAIFNYDVIGSRAHWRPACALRNLKDPDWLVRDEKKKRQAPERASFVMNIYLM